MRLNRTKLLNMCAVKRYSYAVLYAIGGDSYMQMHDNTILTAKPQLCVILEARQERQ